MADYVASPLLSSDIVLIQKWILELSQGILNQTYIPPSYLDLLEECLSIAESSIYYKVCLQSSVTKAGIMSLQPLHNQIVKHHYRLTRYKLKYGNSRPIPRFFNTFSYHRTPEGIVAIPRAPEDDPER